MGSHAISMGRLSKEQVQKSLALRRGNCESARAPLCHIAVAHESTAGLDIGGSAVKYARTMVVE